VGWHPSALAESCSRFVQVTLVNIFSRLGQWTFDTFLLDAPRKIFGFSWAATDELKNKETRKAINHPKRPNMLRSVICFQVSETQLKRTMRISLTMMLVA
jgi:hypothetical protein